MIPAACWNVRGLNKRDHYCAVRGLIQEFNLWLIGLLETRVSLQHAPRFQNVIRSDWSWYCEYSDSGPGNRIWLGWNTTELHVELMESSSQLVHCKVTILSTGSFMFMSFAYGSNDAVLRRELWAQIQLLATSMETVQWLIWGDFNTCVDISEICGTHSDNAAAMGEFARCIVSSRL